MGNRGRHASREPDSRRFYVHWGDCTSGPGKSHRRSFRFILSRRKHDQHASHQKVELLVENICPAVSIFHTLLSSYVMTYVTFWQSFGLNVFAKYFGLPVLWLPSHIPFKQMTEVVAAAGVSSVSGVSATSASASQLQHWVAQKLDTSPWIHALMRPLISWDFYGPLRTLWYIWYILCCANVLSLLPSITRCDNAARLSPIGIGSYRVCTSAAATVLGDHPVEFLLSLLTSLYVIYFNIRCRRSVYMPHNFLLI